MPTSRAARCHPRLDPPSPHGGRPVDRLRAARPKDGAHPRARRAHGAIGSRRLHARPGRAARRHRARPGSRARTDDLPRAARRVWTGTVSSLVRRLTALEEIAAQVRRREIGDLLGTWPEARDLTPAELEQAIDEYLRILQQLRAWKRDGLGSHQ